MPGVCVRLPLLLVYLPRAAAAAGQRGEPAGDIRTLGFGGEPDPRRQRVGSRGAAAKARAPLPLLFGMGVLLYLLSVGLHYAALAAEASREAERREAEARTLAREAELQSLRFQLNPHFLFNSLHSISALATVDGAQARVMCIRLADFLRSSLGLGIAGDHRAAR